MFLISVNTVYTTLSGIILLLAVCLVTAVVFFVRSLRRANRLATRDPLTGGRNFSAFRKEAETCLRRRSSPYALVMMDLRNYAAISQSFGTEQGSRVLNHLHAVLKENLGTAEPFARVDRNAFFFMIKNSREEEIRTRLKRIYDSANRFNLQSRDPYRLALCFGICIPQTGSETLEELIECAMETLSAEGETPRYRFFKYSPSTSRSYRQELVEQMDHSLRSGDFLVYLQPLVRLGDSRISGVEALVRWRHPQRGLLTPDAFVPLMEEYRMIHRLDLYIFKTVCEKMAQWKRSGLQLCPCSVNLSREDLEIEDFFRSCAAMCQTSGVAPEMIVFELSENMFREPPQRIREIIAEIHAFGFRCALANFGKVFTSVEIMRDLEIDALKLNASFFSAQNNTNRNRSMIEAVLKWAAQTHVLTVAEGVDNASQVQYLQQAACDMVQGFYYFKPMPVEEFEKTAYQDGLLRYVEKSQVKVPQIAASRSTSGNSIVMFSYHAEDDVVTFSSLFSPVLEGNRTLSQARALFRTSDLIHENDRKDFFLLLEQCRKSSDWVQKVLRFYTANGRYEWLEVHLHAENAVHGELLITGTLVNVSSWKNQVNLWKEKADRDALTGLYNRAYFEHAAAQGLENGNLTSAAIVFVDIDDFKHINDSLGHTIGDDVLCWVAKRMLGVFRHTDVVARYGGDEFVVFVNGISREDLEKRLDNLCEVFRYPYRNGEICYNLSGSVGAAMYPRDGMHYEELLEHADYALYAAKEEGKDRFALYEPELEARFNQRKA